MTSLARECTCSMHWCIAVAPQKFKLSSYAEKLQGKAKTRYLEKLMLLNGWTLLYWPTVEQERIIQYLLTCNVSHHLRLLILLLTWFYNQVLLLHSSLRPINLWKPIINFLVAGSRMSMHGQSIRNQL